MIMLVGELDMSNADRLRDDLAHASRVHHGAGIIVDASKLTFLDSIGIRVLVESAKQIRGQGHAWHLEGATGIPLTALQVTGVYEYLAASPGTRAGSPAKPRWWRRLFSRAAHKKTATSDRK